MVIINDLKKSRRYLYASVVAMLYPLYIIGLIIYVEIAKSSHISSREYFYSLFPAFLQHVVYLTGLAIIGCIIAFLCSFMALPTSNKWMQALALGMMAIAVLFASWFLFTLM